MHNIAIETPRLILRRITMDDLDDFAALNADPEVRKFYSTGPLTREESGAAIDRMITHYEQCGYGLWATIHRGDNTFIGRCGLIYQDLPGVQDVEVGYMVARNYWCQGLASEAAQAIRDYGFNTLDVPRLISIIHEENIASQRVAEKNGMRHIESKQVFEVPCRIYAITRDEWKNLTNPVSHSLTQP